MEWSDEAIVIGVRPHGETASVVELFTRRHGRHLGLVHGGRSRRNRPVLQLGNHVDATWRARLSENLGHLGIELRRGYAGSLMHDAGALAALSSLTAMLHLLPERDAHPSLYEVTQFVLGFLDEPDVWPALYVRWELALLAELGAGLDLSSCAATGATDGLAFVSPKSGRAVSEAAGEPYRERLLVLPPFLRPGGERRVAPGDVVDGLRLTGHFIEARVVVPAGREMPEARRRLVELVARKAQGAVNSPAAGA